MSWFVSPWVYPICSSLGFLDLGVYFLSHFREFFNYNLLKYFLMPFPFVFWDPCNSKCWVLNVVSEVSETILITFFFFLITFDSFFLYGVLIQLFPPVYFPAHLSSSVSVTLLLGPSSLLLLSAIHCSLLFIL